MNIIYLDVVDYHLFSKPDKTGKYFVDANGAKVTYDAKSQTWSENATQDIRRFAGYLQRTETGTAILKNILSSNIRTSVRFDSKSNDNSKARGKADVFRHVIKPTNRLVKITADIFIYEDEIKEQAALFGQEGVSSSDPKTQRLIDAKLTGDELIESVCVHEGVHATDLQNLSSTEADKNAREMRADTGQFNAISEIKKRISDDEDEIKKNQNK